MAYFSWIKIMEEKNLPKHWKLHKKVYTSQGNEFMKAYWFKNLHVNQMNFFHLPNYNQKTQFPIFNIFKSELWRKRNEHFWYINKYIIAHNGFPVADSFTHTFIWFLEGFSKIQILGSESESLQCLCNLKTTHKGIETSCLGISGGNWRWLRVARYSNIKLQMFLCMACLQSLF